MSTTALDVDSGERAPPPEEGVLDLAQYTLEQVRRDTELDGNLAQSGSPRTHVRAFRVELYRRCDMLGLDAQF